ncbi:MrpH family fimbial adhesin [Pseudomonas sp. 210_17 TE3656]
MLNSKRPYWTALLFLLCFVVNAAHAISIEFNKSQYEPGGARYYFTVTSWEGGGDSACSDTTAVSCSLYLVGAQGPGDYMAMVLSTHSWYDIRPNTSMTAVRNQMRGFSIPFQGSLFVPKDRRVSDSFCISFAQGFSYVGAGGLVAPFGPCAKVIKPALQCEIKGNATINHNNVSDAAIDGNEAAVTLQLTCTGVSSVIASASKENPSGVKLRADGSLYSKLTIDGKAPANGVPIKVEEGIPTPIFIKSTLSSNGTVEPGPFSGSTVLTISPP